MILLRLPCSCCGAGTAADTEKTTGLLSSNLTIFSLNSGRKPRVVMAVNILQDMLYRSAPQGPPPATAALTNLFCSILLRGAQISRPDWGQSYPGRSRLYWEPPVQSGTIWERG